MEAPEKCTSRRDCPSTWRTDFSCSFATHENPMRPHWAEKIPGPDCPFRQIADLVAEGNRMESETDELKTLLAAKDTEIASLRGALEDSNEILDEARRRTHLDEDFMVSDQLRDNIAALKEVE